MCDAEHLNCVCRDCQMFLCKPHIGIVIFDICVVCIHAAYELCLYTHTMFFIAEIIARKNEICLA